MSDNTLPPVGATVTDAAGIDYTCWANEYGTLFWVRETGMGREYVLEVERLGRIVTLSWRLEQERGQLKSRLDAIDAACLEVCRDNHESTVGDDVDTEMGRYVCIGESGDPVIDEDEPAEVVRRLSQVWERMQERSEKAEAERDRTLKANKDLQARVAELEKGRATALYAAVSAVYFDDSSDFRSYLRDVVRTLGGSEMAERLDGEDATSVYDAALRAQEGA